MFTATDVLKPEFIEQPLDTLWSLISPLYMVDETQWLQQLIPLATPTEAEKRTTKQKTTALIEAIRADKTSIQMIDALLLEYSLDTQEGILLMCLAEALMRIPDAATADALATLTMVLGARRGRELLEALPGCEGYLLSKNLEVTRTSNFNVS